MSFNATTSNNISLNQSNTDDCDYIFKVLIIGDSAVGKSSLSIRLSDDIFYQDYASTIAIDFRMFTFLYKSSSIKPNKSLNTKASQTRLKDSGDVKVRLLLWDCAGQARFQSVSSVFYRGANGVFLCFDITSKQSFISAKDNWYNKILQYTIPSIPCVLVGCKLDQTLDTESSSINNRREVTIEEATEWASQHNMEYIETSAKNNVNIINTCEHITKRIFESTSIQTPAPSQLSIKTKTMKKSKKKQCNC